MDGVTSARERLHPGLQVDFPTVSVRKGDTIGNLRRFRGLLRSLQPFTMLTHNFGSIEWAMANRRQIVRHIHVEDGFGPEERTTQITRRVWLRRIFLRHRPVVLPSQTLWTIAHRTWRLARGDLHYIPNGVDLNRFSSIATPWTWPGDGLIVGTIAALRPEKNIGRLIRAFSQLDTRVSARLVIIGDGPQRAELEGLVAELGLQTRVIFEGHVATPDARLKSFDIFAMSSDTEQMPISLLEAMAAGLPTVATNVGDISAMLPEVSRSFVTSFDEVDLASALARLIESKALRHELGRANQLMIAQRFNLSVMLDRWSQLLHSGGEDSSLVK